MNKGMILGATLALGAITGCSDTSNQNEVDQLVVAEGQEAGGIEVCLPNCLKPEVQYSIDEIKVQANGVIDYLDSYLLENIPTHSRLDSCDDNMEINVIDSSYYIDVLMQRYNGGPNVHKSDYVLSGDYADQVELSFCKDVFGETEQ